MTGDEFVSSNNKIARIRGDQPESLQKLFPLFIDLNTSNFITKEAAESSHSKILSIEYDEKVTVKTFQQSCKMQVDKDSSLPTNQNSGISAFNQFRSGKKFFDSIENDLISIDKEKENDDCFIHIENEDVQNVRDFKKYSYSIPLANYLLNNKPNTLYFKIDGENTLITSNSLIDEKALVQNNSLDKMKTPEKNKANEIKNNNSNNKNNNNQGANSTREGESSTSKNPDSKFNSFFVNNFLKLKFWINFSNSDNHFKIIPYIFFDQKDYSYHFEVVINDNKEQERKNLFLVTDSTLQVESDYILRKNTDTNFNLHHNLKKYFWKQYDDLMISLKGDDELNIDWYFNDLLIKKGDYVFMEVKNNMEIKKLLYQADRSFWDHKNFLESQSEKIFLAIISDKNETKLDSALWEKYVRTFLKLGRKLFVLDIQNDFLGMPIKSFTCQPTSYLPNLFLLEKQEKVLDEKFDKVEVKLDKIEKKLEKMDNTLESINFSLKLNNLMLLLGGLFILYKNFK